MSKAKPKNILKQYENEDHIEVGLDEAGRGCLWPCLYSGCCLV